MIEIMGSAFTNRPKIMVIGVGGGGNNALDRMIGSQIMDVNYVAINTDIQVLDANGAEESDRLKASYDEQKAQMQMATGYTNWHKDE